MIYYFKGGDKIGVTQEVLKQLAKSGEVTPETIVIINEKKYKAANIKGLEFPSADSSDDPPSDQKPSGDDYLDTKLRIAAWPYGMSPPPTCDDNLVFKSRIAEWQNGDPNAELFYFSNGDRVGPIRCTHFRKLVSEGRIGSETEIEYSGQRFKAASVPDVIPLAEVPESGSKRTAPASFQEFKNSVDGVRFFLHFIAIIFFFLGIILFFDGLSEENPAVAAAGFSVIFYAIGHLFLSFLIKIFSLGVKSIVDTLLQTDK